MLTVLTSLVVLMTAQAQGPAFDVLAALTSAPCAVAAAPAKVDPRLSNEDDAALNRQDAAILAVVNETLNRVAPQHPEPAERRLALMLIDAVLHDVYAPNRPPIQHFYYERIERAVAEMEKTKVGEGARIWKLYNHGFVVRTPSVTLAFDVYRGPSRFRIDGAPEGQSPGECPGFPIPNEIALRLVKQCDVLFISHKHGDHADEFITQTFLDQGKPVVGAPGVLEGTPVYDKITRLKREADTLQSLKIQNGARDLRVVVYPGQQYQGSGIPNNVVLVFTPEGLSFAHNGDEINDPYPQYQEDFKWIDKIRESHKVDVFMTNCWTNDILRMVKGLDPKLVLPAHENEMGHPMWDRMPYWGDCDFIQSNYPDLKASSYPVLVMTWGESYLYKQARP